MCTDLCDTVGIKELLLRQLQEKIEQRLTIAARQRRESPSTRRKRKDLGKIKEKMKVYQEEEQGRNSIYIMGQNVIGESVPDIAKKLVRRDYEPIANFNGEQEEELGATFVPEGHLPKNPRIVMPQWRAQIEGQFPDDSHLLGELHQTIGDMAEKEAYDALKDYFKEKGEAVVIINGLEMLELDIERRRRQDKREIDFLILNYTHHYLMNLEVKNTLTNDIGQDGLSPIQSAQEQLQGCKQYLEEWFGADLSPNWRFIGAVFCLSQDERVNFCDNCQDFIIIGPDQLPAKMDLMVENLRNAHPFFQKFPEEFKMLVTYTLYCTSVVELPLRGNYPTLVHKAIQQSGSVENIKVWCFPTPQQRMVLNNPKVVFAAPWGSGKTLLMTAKAIELANQGEKVLFLIFNSGKKTSSCESLLKFDLEEKFEGYENITVRPILYFDGRDNHLMDITEGFNHLMVDEFFGDFGQLKPQNQQEFKRLISSKSTVWMALSSQYYESRLEQSVNIDSLLTQWFPGFQVAKMTMPLRLPTKVAEDIKSHYSRMIATATPLRFNDRLFAESSVPSNMAEGRCNIEKFGVGQMKPLHELLQQAFERIPRGKFALIIIQDRPVYSNHAVKALVHCQCKDMIDVVTMDVAMQAIGRPPPTYHCIHYTSGQDDVKAWISGQRNQDMVVSYELIRGFENDFILDITNSLEIISRCSAQLIKVVANPFLDLMCVHEGILKGDHECQDMMTRELRPSLTPSIDDLIGEASMSLKVFTSLQKSFLFFRSETFHEELLQI